MWIERLCAQCCRTDLELVSDIMPLGSQEVPVFMVCSKQRSVEILENGFDVHLSEKATLLKLFINVRMGILKFK